jgi:small subunit ribosomal protein S20
MAHHQSAKKRIRRDARKSEINKSRTSRVRTYVKKVEAAIAQGDRTAAREALALCQPELHRGAQRGVMHRNTAARKLSRLNARIKSMA